MANRTRGQVRRRTRPTVSAAAHEELELDDYDDETEDPAVTPISRAERRRSERRKERARKRKKIVIEDEQAEPIVIELIGTEYTITPPDMGLILDLADNAESSLSPKDQLIEWIDAAFDPDDADDVLDRLDEGEVKWGAIQRLMQAVTAESGRNPTG